MDFFESLFEFGQNSRIAEVSEVVKRLEEERIVHSGDRCTIKYLAEENFELKLRLGLLVRLLVSKNVVTAEEYAVLIAAARPREPANNELES